MHQIDNIKASIASWFSLPSINNWLCKPILFPMFLEFPKIAESWFLTLGCSARLVWTPVKMKKFSFFRVSFANGVQAMVTFQRKQREQVKEWERKWEKVEFRTQRSSLSTCSPQLMSSSPIERFVFLQKRKRKNRGAKENNFDLCCLLIKYGSVRIGGVWVWEWGSRGVWV